MNSSSGESESGDNGRRDPPDERPAATTEARGDAWRVILSDGSRKAAPGRAEESSTAHRSGPSTSADPVSTRPTSADDDGEALETLADFLQDEDLTLLDLDLLSCDLSLLSAEMIRADDGVGLRPVDATSPEDLSVRADRDLAQVVEAWSHLSADLRRAILWIANGGRRSTRDVS